jgi:N-acetyl-gamma-glutamyl-phosphate reductase
MDGSINVAVLGASGFSGGELIRLLHDHPGFDVTFAGAKGSVGTTVGASHPHLAGLPAGDLVLSEMDPGAIAAATDLVFSALPNGTSAGLAPAILDSGVAVIDLAGDFRLPAASYPAWYGFEHPAPGWLDEAVYGLPELFRARVPGAKLVANPGCFATAAIMSCAPILAAGLAEPGPVRVDGKTGVSGAGRAALESTSFGATEDSIRPYRFPTHQHTPEIERGIELATGLSVQALFVPHLVPAVRGVVTTSYLSGASGGMVDAKRTRGTNVIELQAVADPRTGTAVVVGAVDNLVKGAAGQAIQNANLLMSIDEATALPTTAVYP